jgi:hypothetical protein
MVLPQDLTRRELLLLLRSVQPQMLPGVAAARASSDPWRQIRAECRVKLRHH